MLNTQGRAVADYRTWTPARALERAGHDVWWHENDETTWGCRTLGELQQFFAEKAAWADVLHMGFSTSLEVIRLAVTARNYAAKVYGKSLPLIVDCDDDLLNVPSYNTAFKNYVATKEAKRAALWNFRCADALTVSTPPLVPLYAPYNKNITALPNCIHPPEWADLPRNPRRADSADVRIAFAGGIGRKGDLDMIQGAIENVMRQRPQVRLLFMGMMPDWVYEQWACNAIDPYANRAFFIGDTDVRTYRDTMAWLAPDIFIAPVLPNLFNAAKSNLKAMEAPLLGAVPVCSDWETYSNVPTDAAFKCSTEYEWRETLLALIDDPALRAKKVAAGLQWVNDCCTIDSKVHLWYNCFEAALSRPVIGDNGENMTLPVEQQILLATPEEVRKLCLS